MKTRSGFVSNSSSSSYICEVCGNEEIGQDLCLSDCDMFQCKNGHEVCNAHRVVFTKTEDNVSFDEEDDYGVDSRNCPICQYIEISHADFRRYFVKTSGILEATVMAEVKKINGRRKKLHDEEYVEFVLKTLNTSVDEILAEMKSKYPNYKDFQGASR